MANTCSHWMSTLQNFSPLIYRPSIPTKPSVA
uniref:Uncharacterized protein n=1 Tax=Rhizophora mucronata TaxID=61149 RepID=A0A2P2QVA8_RHIMU